ncbi:MAG: putative toxin-antitoxin system toxin component, PIN family [Meiothermus sp.]|uniref:putative toxin-antitoxin system toxin component, PIN family n=1 Tax=Meiothermus sp. TaxID=1955249 RepID=UPI00298ED1D7|nr:putative toxin-antitoxin system toxin component, PIN family [Meiothermus sp.]MCX7784492.1 putative toxin-antitoxin system toxin component, PIN family [Meiothermus sp.]MDW8482285.1 putative toxin-antitoxin system toxin component, PIN family [Meiothermus sp.]
MKIVFDTQIYIRALQPNAYPTEAALFRLWVEKNRFELYTSQTQIEEIRRVSRRKIAQIRIGKAKFGALVTLLKAKAKVLTIPATAVAEVVAADPTDDFIVAIALRAGAEILVSDDKHLKPLKKVGKTRILTPLEALRELKR